MRTKPVSEKLFCRLLLLVALSFSAVFAVLIIPPLLANPDIIAAAAAASLSALPAGGPAGAGGQ